MAIRDYFNLTMVGTGALITNWDDMLDSLRYNMGIGVGTPPVRSPIRITQDDFAGFLSEGILNIMITRAPTADAVPLAIP